MRSEAPPVPSPEEAPLSASYVLRHEPSLHEALLALADKRAVFFAGLPGTGKSLLIHQLAHLAYAQGRRVHLLQWDLSRPVFEASPAGQHYPLAGGVTHAVIRRAVGLWARDALARLHQTYAGAEHLLLGETPLVGNRLIELTTPENDEAESVLISPQTCFVLPVPSNEVRHHIESERRRRFETPLHQRELEDASPDVMQGAWLELVATGEKLGIVPKVIAAELPYDRWTYRTVYEHLLRRRQTRVIALNTLLPTSEMSVYDYPEGCEFVLPADDEPTHWIELAEANPLAALKHEPSRLEDRP